MRALLLGFCMMCAVAAWGARTADTGPAIAFDTMEHDFGSVREDGRKVSFDYIFTNTGTSPLVITRVSVSCRCVDVDHSKKPIPPGGRGVVTVTFNPKKQEGVFYKAIQVYANTAEQRHVIVAKGVVVK